MFEVKKESHQGPDCAIFYQNEGIFIGQNQWSFLE